MYNYVSPLKINNYMPRQKPIQKNEADAQSNSSTKQEQKEKTYNTIYKPTPEYYKNQKFTNIAIKTTDKNPSSNDLQDISYRTKSSYDKNAGMPRQQFPNGEQTAIDYTQSKINISQVIKDFENTTEAIGSPDEIKETVYTYISLVQKESIKDNPNVKIIKSNLKNASQVLDEYITDTLKKPSKVVEGWIDSLFLQNVDYKFDKNAINPDYLVKFPQKGNKSVEQSDISDEKGIVELKTDKNSVLSLLVNAKKEKNPAEALNMFENIIKEVAESDDKKTLSIAYFESGKLYDNFNSIEKAKENYKKAIENSDDFGLKAQAHMKLAKIYHEDADMTNAGENYFSSIGYFGEVDNIKAQAVLLCQTGKLAGEEFDKKNSKDYFDVALLLADEIGDKSLAGKINQKAGDSFSYMNEPKSALDYYKSSASIYDSVQNNLELARDYQSAAQLMLELGNPAKARKLLNKAYKAGLKTEDQDLILNIQTKIEAIR